MARVKSHVIRVGIMQDNLCHPYILSTTVPSDGMKTNNTQSTVYSSVNSSVSYACMCTHCDARRVYSHLLTWGKANPKPAAAAK